MHFYLIDIITQYYLQFRNFTQLCFRGKMYLANEQSAKYFTDFWTSYLVFLCFEVGKLTHQFNKIFTLLVAS